MENIKLAIITGDKDYGRALSLALVDIYKNFTVTLYQSEPVHSQLDGFDLVLKDWAEEEGGMYIYLVEKPSLVDRDYENKIFRLYKYCNVRQLAGELLFIYTALTGRKAVPIKNQDAKIVAFGSTEGGVGCTSAAIAFAQELKRFHDKKVIYLSLEELESTLEYMEPFPGGKSIGEYLYFLFDDSGRERMPFIESFLVFDYYGVDAFLPSLGRNLLKTLNEEEMQFFISAVMDTGRYDFLVIDSGCSLDKNTVCCYEMANHICLISNGQSFGKKEERFLEYMVFQKGETIIDRMAKVVNYYSEPEPQTDETSDQDEEDILRVICRLPEEDASFSIQNGIRTISPDGAYGEGIKVLVDSILLC